MYLHIYIYIYAYTYIYIYKFAAGSVFKFQRMLRALSRYVEFQNISIPTHITTSAPHYHEFAAGSVLTFSKTAAGIVTVCRMSE